MYSKYMEKILRRLVVYEKKVLLPFRSPILNTRPVFILGCGRSGTTMLLNAFTRDFRIETFGENDPRIARNHMLVHERVGRVIENSKAKTLVMKPILNSFDAPKLLASYAQAQIIWMVRDYKDMVASSINMFGSIVASYLREWTLLGTGQNWLCSGIPTETTEILFKLDSSKFTDYDWMALVWWSVNRTIFVNRLYDSERFLLVRYEKLVQEPELALKTIYYHIGIDYNWTASLFVNTNSVGKGKNLKLHPSIEEMCNDLSYRLFMEI